MKNIFLYLWARRAWWVTESTRKTPGMMHRTQRSQSDMTNNKDHRTVNLISERAGRHRATKKKYIMTQFAANVTQSFVLDAEFTCFTMCSYPRNKCFNRQQQCSLQERRYAQLQHMKQCIKQTFCSCSSTLQNAILSWTLGHHILATSIYCKFYKEKAWSQFIPAPCNLTI